MAKYRLTCQSCGAQDELTEEEAFREGWDAPPRFTQVVTCPRCPSSPVVLGHTQPRVPYALAAIEITQEVEA